jgi:hypothetical protein
MRFVQNLQDVLRDRVAIIRDGGKDKKAIVKVTGVGRRLPQPGKILALALLGRLEFCRDRDLACEIHEDEIRNRPVSRRLEPGEAAMIAEVARAMTATDAAADALMQRLTSLSVKAAEAASSLRVVETSGSSVLARVNAATGVTGGVARDRADIEAYGRALDEVRAKYNPMFAAVQKYRSELAQLKQAHAAGAISADEYTAALSRLRQASLREIGVIKGRVLGYQHMAKAGGLARFQIVQLGYQLNDIGVSLASGQNPFVVLVQQGAQIAQIYGGQGGVWAALSQIGSLLGGLAKRAWPVALIAGAFAGPSWRAQLEACFGTADWFEEAYSLETNLLGEEVVKRPDAAKRLVEFYVRRVDALFGNSAAPSLVRNTRGNPLYHLIWAASNPTGKPIAKHILDLGDRIRVRRGPGQAV